jgi:transposase-like protein
MAQRLMELDIEQRCGAGYDEKSAERLNSRNGCWRRPKFDPPVRVVPTEI